MLFKQMMLSFIQQLNQQKQEWLILIAKDWFNSNLQTPKKKQKRTLPTYLTHIFFPPNHESAIQSFLEKIKGEKE